MSKTKKTKPQVVQGGINIKGNATIKNSRMAGRDIVENKTVNVNISFAPVYHALKESETITPEVKKAVEENIKQIEREVGKGNKAKGSFIQERLENIQKMAPDIAEVVVATLQNPAAGIGLAVKKVITKYQAEKNQ
jgi:DNA topoisomerase VI subunit B